MSTHTRHVRFQYCISLIFFTWHRSTEIVVIPSGRSAFSAGFPYSIITFLLGWWAIPWGLLLTPRILFDNLRGGIPVPISRTHGAQSEDFAHSTEPSLE